MEPDSAGGAGAFPREQQRSCPGVVEHRVVTSGSRAPWRHRGADDACHHVGRDEIAADGRAKLARERRVVRLGAPPVVTR